MTLKGRAYIAGIYEHPLRRAGKVSTAQLHAEVALGALVDAVLTLDDVDGYFCGASPASPGLLRHDRRRWRRRGNAARDRSCAQAATRPAHWCGRGRQPQQRRPGGPDLFRRALVGGPCNNHHGNKGGMTKILEAVRQCRGEAHPAVQVRNHDLVLAHGTGGQLSGHHAAGTLIFEAE